MGMIKFGNIDLCYGVLSIFILLAGVSMYEGQSISEPGTFPLQMPNVKPQKDNAYLCYGVQIDPKKSFYITRYQPLDNSHAAHHMLLYGCEEPGSSQGVWTCGEMASHKKEDGTVNSPCKTDPSILYAWAHNAPDLQLPEETGFKIGSNTKIKSLVLQIHYAHVDQFKNSDRTDDSGLVLTLTDRKLPQEAGVLLLLSGGSIPPHSKESMEIACKIDNNVKLHPFAFRTHTHKLGVLVSGYVIKNGLWIRLGQKSPQLEQMFYPIENNVTIEKNDMVVARCIMANNRSEKVFIGPTMDDEMCNFYLMYYQDAASGHRGTTSVRLRDPSGTISQGDCFSPGPPNWYWKHADIKMPDEPEPPSPVDRNRMDDVTRNEVFYPENYDEGTENWRGIRDQDEILERDLKVARMALEPQDYDYAA